MPPRLTLALAALLRLYRGDTIELRDEEPALRHFQRAWGAGNPAETARRALSWWAFPPSLLKGLEPAVGDLLEEMEHTSMADLLRRINNGPN